MIIKTRRSAASALLVNEKSAGGCLKIMLILLSNLINNMLENLKKNKGIFIVIDGTDGSGKKTQTDLIYQRLKNNGFNVELADFPQYGKKSAGLVEDYLNGKYGTAEEVGPYRASIFYACDRYDASFKIKQWLEQGKIVISNRYVTANMGHQGGKIQDDQDRHKYFDWLYNLEYKIFNIPKPDLNIILHVDAAIAQKMVDSKGAREYVGGIKRDIHEADINHLRQAEKVYLQIARSFSDFILIECSRNYELMSREEINDMIWQEILKIINHSYAKNEIQMENRQHAEYQNILIQPNAKQLVLKVEKISPLAKLPTRAHSDDAGLDLYATDYYTLMPGERATIKNGIRLEIPQGYAGLVWDKSGISTKNGIHTIAGVIDAGYRGEMAVNVINLSREIYNIIPGQKIAQLLIQKIETPQIIETTINKRTDRGESGYGHSGLF